MNDAIKVAGLTKLYDQNRRGVTPVLAVDHVSFQVRQGEVFGFLGPNGAGKTTTINILTTLLPPTAGTARVLGHDAARDAYGVREEISIVPEISNIYEEYSAWGNTGGALFYHPRPECGHRDDAGHVDSLAIALCQWTVHPPGRSGLVGPGVGLPIPPDLCARRHQWGDGWDRLPPPGTGRGRAGCFLDTLPGSGSAAARGGAAKRTVTR